MTLLVNFLKRKVRMATWHISLVKIASGCLGVAIGATFSDQLRAFVVPLIIVALAAGAWVTVIWLQALNEDQY